MTIETQFLGQLAALLEQSAFFQNFDQLPKSEKDFLQLLVGAGYIRSLANAPTELAQALTERPFMIDPIAAEILTNISEQLAVEFSGLGLALVLAGSKAHGGSVIRRFLLGQNNEDYDLVLLANRELLAVQQNQIGERARQLLRAAKHEVCDTIAIEHFSAKNLANREEAQAYLLSLAEVEIYDWSRAWDNPIAVSFIIFCQPSFPRSVNVQNLTFLLEAWRSLYQDARYTQNFKVSLKTKMRMTWNSVHQLEPKHLPLFSKDAQTGETEVADREEKVATVARFSKQVMYDPLKNLFEQAANNPDFALVAAVEDYFSMV